MPSKQATDNRQRISNIRRRLQKGEIDLATAKVLAKPTIDHINDMGRQLAKKYNRRHTPITFSELMR